MRPVCFGDLYWIFFSDNDERSGGNINALKITSTRCRLPTPTTTTRTTNDINYTVSYYHLQCVAFER